MFSLIQVYFIFYDLYSTVVPFLHLFATVYTAPEILTSGFEEGSGPIFLDQLQCSESDESLLHCAMGRTIGLHHCNHSMDVGIKCSGNEHSSPELANLRDWL